jgi:hypothetical protein
VALTTTSEYTFVPGTVTVASATVTPPIVTATQNGPGMAAPTTTYFDALERPTWGKDAAGYLHYTEYDPATGAVVKSIVDVDSTQTSDFVGLPSGWSTPSGGGLHLRATAEVDAFGRPTASTDPNGNVSYMVYLDVAREVRAYAGWDEATGKPTGPTVVSREDWTQQYSETLTMVAQPTLDGNGRPKGTEALAQLRSLRRQHVNQAGQPVQANAYFNVTGLTYSTSKTLGTVGVNYDRTTMAYDDMGRVRKTTSPAGTITRYT